MSFSVETQSTTSPCYQLFSPLSYTVVPSMPGVDCALRCIMHHATCYVRYKQQTGYKTTCTALLAYETRRWCTHTYLSSPGQNFHIYLALFFPWWWCSQLSKNERCCTQLGFGLVLLCRRQYYLSIMRLQSARASELPAHAIAPASITGAGRPVRYRRGVGWRSRRLDSTWFSGKSIYIIIIQ